MLIEELIGSRVVLENDAIKLQHAVEDILLRARKGNIPELNLADIAGEVSTINMYIDPDDTDEMIHAIRLVLEDKKKRTEMQEKGYEHAQKFKEEVIADNLMKVYRKII